MSRIAKHAMKESFQTVPETCPAIDQALKEAEFAIKTQTGMLRTALTEALERAMRAEDECIDLRAEVARLQREIDSMVTA